MKIPKALTSTVLSSLILLGSAQNAQSAVSGGAAVVLGLAGASIGVSLATFGAIAKGVPKPVTIPMIVVSSALAIAGIIVLDKNNNVAFSEIDEDSDTHLMPNHIRSRWNEDVSTLNAALEAHSNDSSAFLDSLDELAEHGDINSSTRTLILGAASK